MTPREELEKRIADVRRLLEARIARRAPEWMIENVRRELQWLEEMLTGGAQQVPAVTGGWWHAFWSGEVGSPLPQRKLGERGVVKTVALFVAQVVIGVIVGIVLGQLLRTSAGQYALRSALRGVIYRSIRAF